MATERTGDQLRAIIRTQTEIAASDLDAEAIMQLIGIADEVRAAALGQGTISTSFGIATTVDRNAEVLMTVADSELLGAKHRLYGRDLGE